MTVSNLYAVTDSLARLLNFNVRRLFFTSGVASALTVSTMPPELVGDVTERLNLHLYHSTHDPHYKNLGGSQVAQKPLALCLYYILTAHHALNTNFDTEMQQDLMGLAMKTFHDQPVITDDLAISPDGGVAQTVMAPSLLGAQNKFEVIMRPITPEESTNFWSAEQTSTPRLSAFYEVRTAFLAPEPAISGRGRVISVALDVSPVQAPQLDRSRSVSSFTPPVASGLPPQAFAVSPAQPTLETTATSEFNSVTLEGSSLAGDGTRGAATLVLRHDGWRELSPPIRTVRVDPDLNPDWAVVVSAATVSFRVQPTVIIDVGAGPESIDVNPGTYTTAIEVRRETRTRSGTQRFSAVESKQLPFTVGPHISAVGPVSAVTGRFTIEVAPNVDLTRPSLNVQLRVDGEVYEQVEIFDDAPTDAGSFVAQATELEFHPLFDGAEAGAHSVALVVNGAESQPFWIEVP